MTEGKISDRDAYTDTDIIFFISFIYPGYIHVLEIKMLVFIMDPALVFCTSR